MVTLNEIYETKARAAAHQAYVNAPEFPALVDAARERGYRHASLYEIESNGPSDLFCWRGGLWVRDTPDGYPVKGRGQTSFF